MTTTAKPGRSLKWLHGLACGAALAWLPSYSLFIGILSLPLIAAYFFDRSDDQALPGLLLPYVCAALMHPVRVLWNADGSMDSALAQLMDPMVLLIAWGAAGLGWFVLELSMAGAKLGKQFQLHRRKAQISKRLAEISEEWDQEAGGRPSASSTGS